MKKLVNALSMPRIKELLAEAPAYQKSGVTLGRLKSSSDPVEFITYTSDGKGGYEEEGRNSADGVVARNPIPIVDGIYNEWIISKDKWIELYGKLPVSDTEFEKFKRQGTSKFIKITDEVAAMLGGTDDSGNIYLEVSWDPDGVIAKIGDYLAEGGHRVEKREFANTWELAN